MSRATSIAAAPAASGSWTRAARNSAASCTARRQRPTSPSAAPTGKPCTSPAATTSARSSSRSPASRCRSRNSKETLGELHRFARNDAAKALRHCEERSGEAISLRLHKYRFSDMARDEGLEELLREDLDAQPGLT